MFQRQTSGSVVCPGCGRLVGVHDKRCMGCGRKNPGLWGFAPLLGRLGQNLGFTEVVVGVCTVIFIASLIYAPSPMPESASLGALFSLFSPQSSALYQFGAAGAIPVVFGQRWWTVLAAAWLHGGVFHIFMNMMALRQLLPAVCHFYGTSRAVILYTVSAVTGFLMTSWMGVLGPVLGLPRFFHGAPLTIGASAPLLGMCGALIYAGRRGSASGALTRQITQWVVILFVIGFLIPVIDNWAHLGGLIGGYLAARWLDPMKEETPAHGLAAVACLALSGLSLLLSWLLGRPLDTAFDLWQQFQVRLIQRDQFSSLVDTLVGLC